MKKTRETSGGWLFGGAFFVWLAICLAVAVLPYVIIAHFVMKYW